MLALHDDEHLRGPLLGRALGEQAVTARIRPAEVRDEHEVVGGRALVVDEHGRRRRDGAGCGMRDQDHPRRARGELAHVGEPDAVLRIRLHAPIIAPRARSPTSPPAAAASGQQV